jgi:crossover junction endodeoxyribonuclease RuvC
VIRALGIDPGTATTGYGLVEHDTSRREERLIEFGTVRTASGTPMAQRLVELHDGVRCVIESLDPDVVAVEELFFARNVSTALTVGQARGVILLAAAQSGLPVYEYKPREIKLALTGYGAADKRQVQEMVRIMLRLSHAPQPDDAADAVATALTYLQMRRHEDLDRSPTR